MGKNPANYETIRKETNIYEQKPVNIDDFNKSEEAEVKEWVEKQKEKRPIQGWKKTVEKKKEQVKQNQGKRHVGMSYKFKQQIQGH